MTGAPLPPADPAVDLYDEARPPGSRWTRVNIGEAIPGVPTPLSWSIWKPAMEHAFWWSQVQLGVAARREAGRAPVTTIALGHPAISVDVTIDQVARLPGYDADAFAEQYFGLTPTRPTVVSSTSPRTVARVAWRAPRALVTIGRRVAANATSAEAAWSRAIHGSAPMDAVALLATSRAHFVDAMAVHTLAGLLCQGAYDRVSSLAPDLASALVSVDGQLAEARLAGDLWAVAHGGLDEAAFLARHGFHGPEEGELSAPSWREDPAPVRSTVAAWADADARRSPAAAAARRAADRATAEQALLDRLPRRSRPSARLALRTARQFVAQREVGKAAFLRHLDVARLATRHLGEDAIWCTYEELAAGRRPAPVEVSARRARREELAALDLPLSFVGDPVPIAAVDRASTTRPIAGVGASPGVVTGLARVVLDPAALVEPVGPDEVLVARTTDPSWVTLFLTAGALVIDVGGALSHGAIIARELGIPCVIGTEDGTARIADGVTCTVDGTAGTVTLS